MNFSTAGLNILSNNTTQLNATYLQNAFKLSEYSTLTKPIYGKSFKKILVSGKQQLLTQITKNIVDILPITSSCSLVLREVLKKTENLGDGSTTVVLFAALLSQNLLKLVDDGFSRKNIANSLRKIRTGLELVRIDATYAELKDSRKIISGILKDQFLIDLVGNACDKIFDDTDRAEIKSSVNTLQKNNAAKSRSSYKLDSLREVPELNVKKTNESSQDISLGITENDKTECDSYVHHVTYKEAHNHDFKIDMIEGKLVSEIEDRIRIVKIATGTTNESVCIDGLVFKGIPTTSKTTTKYSKTAIYSCPVEISRTTEKGILQFTSAEQLLDFTEGEQKNISKTVDELTSNADLVICSGQIEETFLHYFDDKNALVYNIPSKHDIRRIRNLFGGLISPVLKSIHAENTGKCERVTNITLASNDYTWFKNKNTKVSTIILYNAIPLITDENERMIAKAFKALISHYPKYIISKGCGYFEKKVIDQIGNICHTEDMYESGVIKVFKKTVSDLISEIKPEENIYDLLNIRVKAFQYAIDVCCVVLETQDMFAVRDALDIGRRPDLPRDI